MIAVWKFIGIVALAVVAAFATFQDSIALGIGAIGLATTVIIAALVLIGAGAALLQSGPRNARAATAAAPSDDLDNEVEVNTLGR